MEQEPWGGLLQTAAVAAGEDASCPGRRRREGRAWRKMATFPLLREEVRRALRQNNRAAKKNEALWCEADAQFQLSNEDPEVSAVKRAFGQRKARRYLNEKLLRDMAGPLTVEDMHKQYTPAPFGVPRTTPLTRLFTDDESGAAVREAMLALAESEENAGAESKEKGARARKHGWANVSRRGKAAIKTAAGAGTLSHIEQQFVEALRTQTERGEAAVSVPSSYHRLLWYAIAEYYGVEPPRKEPPDRLRVCAHDKDAVLVRKPLGVELARIQQAAV